MAVLLALLAGGQLPGLAQGQTASRVAAAEAVLDALVARDFVSVVAQFDDTMRGMLPGNALGDSWDATAVKTGKFVRRISTQEQQKGAYTAVTIACEFELAKLDVAVVFNANGQISGLSIRPPASAATYTTPDYVVAGAYTERDVTVGSGEWALPGTLSMPVGPGPFPAVVLVHGSGPNDRDETIGPNKMFKDLALGLASRGIAVLRYDKRTKVYPAKMALQTQFTVKEEAIDDALAAVAVLRGESSVDPARIFVLGHSLGGMIAPRIGAADPKIAGLVIMAGAVRSLEQSMYDQYRYLAGADGTVTAAEQKMIDDAKQTIDVVANLTPEDAKAGKMVVGAPAAYWIDLRGYEPPAAAARLTQRVLVLQGERDYQVTAADFVRWQVALAGIPTAQFKLYPSLNHLFLDGTGKSLPAEYAVPGHVPVGVIDDIATWIKR